MDTPPPPDMPCTDLWRPWNWQVSLFRYASVKQRRSCIYSNFQIWLHLALLIHPSQWLSIPEKKESTITSFLSSSRICLWIGDFTLTIEDDLWLKKISVDTHAYMYMYIITIIRKGIRINYKFPRRRVIFLTLKNWQDYIHVSNFLDLTYKCLFYNDKTE